MLSTSVTNPLTLTIVVPTVEGRSNVLSRCLASIREQIGEEQVNFLVSGNGTNNSSQKIAEAFDATFIHRPVRLSAEDHALQFMKDVDTQYTWIVGDDDALAPNALKTVLETLLARPKSETPLHAIIGRAQNFTRGDFTDVGAPFPTLAHWHPGQYRAIGDVASATKGEAHHGAFVFSTNLFNEKNYNKYLGTSHAIFGAFWEGLAALEYPTVTIVESPLVLLEWKNDKEWDCSPMLTLAGLNRYYRLLPENLWQQKISQCTLTRRWAIILASQCQKGQESDLAELVNSFYYRQSFAVMLTKIHPKVAKTIRNAGRPMTWIKTT